jgi:hypothetical protein
MLVTSVIGIDVFLQPYTMATSSLFLLNFHNFLFRTPVIKWVVLGERGWLPPFHIHRTFKDYWSNQSISSMHNK